MSPKTHHADVEKGLPPNAKGEAHEEKPKSPPPEKLPDEKSPAQQAVAQGDPTASGESAQSDSGDGSEKLFAVYIAHAKKVDEEMVEGWQEDMDSILIFVRSPYLHAFKNSNGRSKAGLFSGVLTAFILQVYPGLQPDTSGQMLVYLAAISQQLAASSNPSISNQPAPSVDQLSGSFRVDNQTLRVNAYWFVSLTLSLICAFSATLVKQWARNYMVEIARQSVVYKRARVRAFLFEGIQSFHLPALVHAIPTLLHLSLLIFFIGLVEFLLPTSHLLAYLFLGILIAGFSLYAFTLVAPCFSFQCPYQTPLSDAFFRIVRYSRECTPRIRIRQGAKKEYGYTTFGTKKGPWSAKSIADARELLAVESSRERDSRDMRSLNWTLEQLTEDYELDPFMEGLKGFANSSKVNGDILQNPRFITQILNRTPMMLRSCIEDGKLIPSRHDRLIGCFDAITLLVSWMGPRFLYYGGGLNIDQAVKVIGDIAASEHSASTQAQQTLDTLVKSLLDKSNPRNQAAENHALTLAASFGYAEVVRLILERGESMDRKGDVFLAAMYSACQFGHNDAVRVLLEHGADVNALLPDPENNFLTPLQVASREGSSQVVRTLLNRGANVNVKGGFDSTALMAATYWVHAPADGRESVVPLLLESGADVNAHGGRSGSDNALGSASYLGNEAAIRVLLKYGADVNAQGGEFGNALQAASSQGNLAIVRILLENGADVNAQGGKFGSALQAACLLDDDTTARVLLEHGANVNATGGEYGSAIGAARSKQRDDIVQLLLRHGTK